MASGGPKGARAAAIDAARRRAAATLPDGLTRRLARMRGQIAEWALAEVAPGLLLPWLPVAFGTGVALYFGAEREPQTWAISAAFVMSAAAALALRRRPVAFPVALGLAALAGGFAIATLQTARVAHPILSRAVGSVAVSGFVETREERERSDRIVVRLHDFDALRTREKPERVRISVRAGTAPEVGSFVTLKAHLSPPLAPLRPGGYDFARDLYFQQIGASGYALGKLTVSQPSVQIGWRLRIMRGIDEMRESINRRIRQVLPGDRGSIASALITGKRGALSAPVSDAFYVSSLAHVLAISGYHMAVVAGIAFLVIRGGLALIPQLALRHPIKKWAAVAALGVGAFYLVLSGASVSTQRAFIMIALVLIGVLLDRSTLTFRTITIAALIVMLAEPHTILHPSFQMSFAAALALIAVYQHQLRWHGTVDTSRSARVALWGVNEVVALILASTIAGLATTPYAAFHFHRLAPYGVLANLFAMPVVSALVMPMGILGVVAIPFGFDGPCWQAMGFGIDWMIAVVLWVAHLPGALGRLPAFGTGPLLLGTLALLVLCLLRTPLRWSGAVLAVIASLWAVLAPRPDIFISTDGQTAAVRAGDGQLRLLHSGRDSFALKEWLAADADSRDVKHATVADGARCDAIGCAATLKDGRLVTMALATEALAEDCTRAAVVISPHEANRPCGATLIDRKVWRPRGAMTLRWTGEAFEARYAQPPGYDRPWARELVEVRPAPAQDATPPIENLDADD